MQTSQSAQSPCDKKKVSLADGGSSLLWYNASVDSTYVQPPRPPGWPPGIQVELTDA